MTSTLGDARALHLLHVNNALTRNALRAYRGREIKHTGDGIMASFTAVADAIACAVEIQRAVAGHNRHHPEEAIFVRIGLAAGEPIEEHGDFFGHAVQLAARLCALAQPSQILVSQLIFELAQDSDVALEEMGPVQLKGFEVETHVYSIPWAAE
jgi:class 3 adenylate cyclase